MCLAGGLADQKSVDETCLTDGVVGRFKLVHVGGMFQV